MDKRYQVFVSSTYGDLREERSKVIQTLMEMDCIPAGMELFPAADEEQFEFIKRVIDDCDYYLVIIGGRYGTLTAEGISFTEKEYDYAVCKDLRIVVLLHEDPDQLAAKTDADPEARAKLERFREKVSHGRIVKMWKKAEDIPGLVALSMQKTMRTYPATGWVRANSLASKEILAEINELRKRNEGLSQELEAVRGPEPIDIPDLAPLDEDFEITGVCTRTANDGIDRRFWWDVNATWGEIFSFIAPHLLMEPLYEHDVRETLSKACFFNAGQRGRDPDIHEQVFQTVKVQLLALNVIQLEPEMADYSQGVMIRWMLTSDGRTQMFRTMAVRKGQSRPKIEPTDPEPVEPEPQVLDDDIPF